MEKKILHIANIGGDPWVLPIWNAFNNAEKNKKIRKPDANFIERASNKALSLSTKFNFLPIICHRINKNCEKLYEEVKTRNKAKDKYALKLKTDDIDPFIKTNSALELLIDIDCLFFEMSSACELMEKFTQEIFDHIKKKDSAKDFVKNLIFRQNISKDWYLFIVSKRNHFIHEGAPYLCVILDNEPKYDIIITLKNITVFNNPQEYFLLSELNEVIKGFHETRKALQTSIIDILNNI